MMTTDKLSPIERRAIWWASNSCPELDARALQATDDEAAAYTGNLAEDLADFLEEGGW